MKKKIEICNTIRGKSMKILDFSMILWYTDSSKKGCRNLSQYQGGSFSGSTPKTKSTARAVLFVLETKFALSGK